jgi:hypothetical protein
LTMILVRLCRAFWRARFFKICEVFRNSGIILMGFSVWVKVT